VVWGRLGRGEVREGSAAGAATLVPPLHRRASGRRLEQDLRSALSEDTPAAVRAAEPPPARRFLASYTDGREATLRFRRAAVAMALSPETGEERRIHAEECASALVDLASGCHEDLLASLLKADPGDGESTWTVACYQIGDLSPTTLKDFAEAVPAVAHLYGCESASHVAAELIVTNPEGVRWTVVVRSGDTVAYQPLGSSTGTAPTPAALLRARHAWEDQLLGWASEPSLGLEPPAPAPPTGTPSPPAGGEPEPAGAERGVAVGMVLGQVLEAVREISRRLPAGDEPALSAAPGGVAALREQVAGLEARLAASDEQIGLLRAEVRRLAGAGAPGGGTRSGPAGAGLLTILCQWALSRLAERDSARAAPPRPGRAIELVETGGPPPWDR
jgi:hypothetical protein